MFFYYIGTNNSEIGFCVSSTVPKEEAEDLSTYKVKEYFSYNEWSFYDIENDIDASGRRQTQPDPKVKYTHSNPWTTNEKAAA